MIDQVKKAERVRALAKRLGFESCLLVMHPNSRSTQLSVVLDADDPGRFVAMIAEPVASLFDAVMDENDDEA